MRKKERHHVERHSVRIKKLPDEEGKHGNRDEKEM